GAGPKGITGAEDEAAVPAKSIVRRASVGDQQVGGKIGAIGRRKDAGVSARDALGGEAAPAANDLRVGPRAAHVHAQAPALPAARVIGDQPGKRYQREVGCAIHIGVRIVVPTIDPEWSVTVAVLQ